MASHPHVATSHSILAKELSFGKASRSPHRSNTGFNNASPASSMSSNSSLSSTYTSGLLSLSPSDSGSSFLGTRFASLGIEASSSQGRGQIAPGSVVAGLGGVLGGLFGGGDPSEKTRQAYADRVNLVNSFEPSLAGLSDEQLREKTSEMKQRVAYGQSLDDILPVAFALVREASKRVLGLRPFDVQLIGGMVLHKGEIAEMRTGEGKTLVAVLPAFLNALSGKGVHVVTVNDYLARRDCEWVGQVHRFLGLNVGLIQQGMEAKERRENYACDVTYVTNSELGFDFLRDNLATSKEDLVLREFSYCIIDEVDSILIDEARTPLIISGTAEKPSERYIKAALMANAFGRDVHYTVDEKQKSAQLTEEGYEEAESLLQVKDLYDPKEQWASYVLNAIKAKELFLKDVNYIVRANEILIVDEFTGRVMPGRRWSDGLHQAIEAKEKVPIQNETITLASISYQNFFLQYPKLCGMTGTAATETEEFQSIYKLKVTVIPTNRIMVRKDESDVVFRSENGKWRAAVVEVARMHKVGRPCLVGTTSVEQSESLSQKLTEANIPHQVLNAKPENVEREAEIVAQSGRLNAVTIATNMAGRGTDIILGGNAEFMARLQLRMQLMPRIVATQDDEIPFEGRRKPVAKKNWEVRSDFFPCPLPPSTQSLIDQAVETAVKVWGEKKLPALEAEDRLSYACEKGPTSDEVISSLRIAFEQINADYRVYTDEEKKKVIAAGGLHVVGTERHESRRIDNQLRGRSGRQGDPGSSRFFLSLEDNIFRIFGGDRIKGLMKAFRVEDLPIESKMLTKALDEAQRKVEAYFFEIRKQLFEYDQVLNSQRDRVYAERRKALVSESLENLMIEYAELTMEDILEANVDASQPEENWNLEPLLSKIKQYCYLLNDLDLETLKQYATSYESLGEFLRTKGREAYYVKKAEVEAESPGLMKEAERFFVLSQTDNLWKEHLQALKFVQQAVGLRGYAQKDPLIEYKLEGYNLFLDMMAQIRRNVIYSVYQFKAVKAKATGDTQGAQEGESSGTQTESAEDSSGKSRVAVASASSRSTGPRGGKKVKSIKN